MAIIVVSKGGGIELATDYFEVEHNGEELFKIDGNKDAKFIADVIDGNGNKLTNCYRYGTGNTNTSTKMKIKIKGIFNWMICFTVTLYQNYRATKVMVSGYNYYPNGWYMPKAVILGDSKDITEDVNINVYFGYDSPGDMWVAFDKDLYTGIIVSDITNGYQQFENYNDLITISEVAASSLGTISITQNVKRRRVYEFEEAIYYTSSTSMINIGTWKMPFTGFLEMHLRPIFGQSRGIASAISTGNNLNSYNVLAGVHESYSYTSDCSLCGVKLAANTTLYLFTAHQTAASNRAYISGRVTSL